MTRAELLALPAATDVPTAGLAFDLGRLSSYRAVANGTFPVPVLRVGRRIIVPTAEILRVLGVTSEEASTSKAAAA